MFRLFDLAVYGDVEFLLYFSGDILSIGSAFVGAHQALIALLILFFSFITFVLEKYPPAVVAICAAAAFMLFGFVNPEEVQQVFANSAPITIAAMFVISGALVRTGCIEIVVQFLTARAVARPVAVILVTLVLTMIASAFINNTAMTFIMVPVILKICNITKISSSRVLIPLSYITILGGMCTLLGTSSNLLVNGLAEKAGIEPFSIFEITPIGLVVAIVGSISLFFLSRIFLPQKPEDTKGKGESAESEKFVSEILVLPESSLIGKQYGAVSVLSKTRIALVMLIRGGNTRRYNIEAQTIQAGDRFLVRANPEEIITLNLVPGFHTGIGRPQKGKVRISKAVILPDRRGLDSSLAELSLAERYNVKVLAVQRVRALIAVGLHSARLRASDVLLLEGSEENIQQMMLESDFLDMEQTLIRPYHRSKAPIVLVAIIGMLLLSMFTSTPIVFLALFTVAVVLGFRCIDLDEALKSIDGSVLILICAMMTVGKGLENTGAIISIVDISKDWLAGQSVLMTIIVVYFVTSFLSEIVTNSAVAVISSQLAIEIAQNQGIDAKALLVAVMFASSASFATPIGYHTNTFVYRVGNYRFSDFLKIGISMNIIVGFTACYAIYFFMLQ